MMTGISWINWDDFTQSWLHRRSSFSCWGNCFLQSLCPVWSWLVFISWRLNDKF